MFIRALRLRTLAVGLESRKLGHRIGVVGGCREVGGLGGGGVGRQVDWGEGEGRGQEEETRNSYVIDFAFC